jgi:butyryl-CoA dehydrogenase
VDFNLNDEQIMLIDTIRKLGEREKLREQAKHIDATGEFPEHLMTKYAELGLLGMCLGAEWGGSSQPALNAVLAVEELAKFSPMIASPVFESNVGPIKVIEQFGSEEQRKTLIPSVCSGECSVELKGHISVPQSGQQR